MSSERSPLMERCEIGESSHVLIGDATASGKTTSTKATPLPKLQMFTVMYIQLTEPITASVIFPFVVQLVRDTGVTGGDESKVGYYAGFIESIFFAAEAMTVLQWGWASDRLGRKPILLLGAVGLAAAIIFFGLSRHFWMLVISRCAQGVFNGNIGVTKAVMSEITDQSNIGQAFGFIPMMWATGVTLGPIIGGILSHPADTWPDTFGRLAFFRYYPYILPCAVAALVPLSAVLVISLFLKETLPSAVKRQKNKNKKHFGSISEDSSLIEAPNDSSAKQPLPFRALLTRPILVPIFCYVFLVFISQCCDVLIPLTLATSIAYGGLGLNSFTIGTMLGCLGILNGVVSAVLFPKLLARLGIWKLYMVSFPSLFVIVAGFPLSNYLARRAGHVDGYVWLVLSVQLLVFPFAYMTYGCIFIYFNDSAPTKSTLGAVNGLAQMTGSTVRTFGPLAVSSLFALSQQRNILGGTFVYWVICLVWVAGWAAATRLPRQLRSK